MPDAKVIRFPPSEQRIERVDPGPVERLTAQVAGRVPPHSIEAERAVLGAILAAPVVLSFRALPTDAAEIEAAAKFRRRALDVALEMLKPESFYSHEHARIFQAVQQLSVERVPVDKATVCAKLKELDWLARVGGERALHDLATDAPTGNIEAHATKILECCERREFISVAQRFMVGEYDNPEEWEPRKARIREVFEGVTAPRCKLVGVPIGVAADEAHANVQAVQTGAVAGVPWCFEQLDHFGLLAEGKQHILAARPGMGKTALAFQVAVRIAELRDERYGLGEVVYFCSWEMRREDLILREACSLAGISYKALQRKRVDADGQERLAMWLRRLRTLPIWVDDRRCSPGELAVRVQRVRDLAAAGALRRSDAALYPKCNLRAVAIDQLSEVSPPPSVANRVDRREVVGATAKELQRKIAQELGVATLVLCQIARPKPGAKVEEPTLSELRESGQIEESADEVIALHRPEYYSHNVTAELRNVARVIPLKGRYGHEKPGLLGFYGGRFDDNLPPAALGQPYHEQ